MDKIILKSGVLTVVKINRKTKAKMFTNLKIGDKIQLSAGRNSGSYATYIDVVNVGTGERTLSTFNQLPSILNAFELVGHLQVVSNINKDVKANV